MITHKAMRTLIGAAGVFLLIFNAVYASPINLDSICDGSRLSYVYERFMYSVCCRQGKTKTDGEDGVIMFIPEQSHIVMRFTCEA